MKNILVFFVFCLVTVGIHSQSQIRTKNAMTKDIYGWVSFMTKGNLFINESEKEKEFPVGEVLRLLITTSEIYNGIYIEGGTQNSGGKMELKWRRKINENDLYSNFPIKGEFTNVEFVKWNSWNSFTLKIQGIEYMFNEVQKSPILVEKK